MRRDGSINFLYPDSRPAATTDGDALAVTLVFGFLLGAAAMAIGVGLGAWLLA